MWCEIEHLGGLVLIETYWNVKMDKLAPKLIRRAY